MSTMSLRNNASLTLTTSLAEENIFKADIEGYGQDTYKLAYDLACGLAAKSRFAGQLRCIHYSVLHHSYLVGMTAEHMGLSNDVVRQAYLHDIGEAFFADIPSPFKTTYDKFREQSLIDEISRLLDFKIGEPTNEVKSLDNVAALVEASILGKATGSWTWVTAEILNLTPHEYQMFDTMCKIIYDEGWLEESREELSTTDLIKIDQQALNNLIVNFPLTLQRLEII